MKKLSPFLQSLQNAGGGIMLAGVVGHLFFPSITCPVLFLTGTLLFGCTQMLERYEGRNVVIRRLRRIQVFSDIALIISGFGMLLPYVNLYYGHRNEWLIFFAIGVFLQLYTAFRLPYELEKEK